jgi:hypothetical protein
MNIDALIKLHDSRLYSLERNFHHDLEDLQSDFLTEKNIMISKFKHDNKELAAIIDAIEQEEESRDNEVEKRNSFEYIEIILKLGPISIGQAFIRATPRGNPKQKS